MRYILTAIGLLTVLGVIANALGGAMWDLADSMPLWWEGEMEDEK
jgi:hypothetical protein